MFLKKVDGPRAVTLPDGRVLSLADLPDPNTRRWVASRKMIVVLGVHSGLMTRREALQRYDLSDEEFESWETSAKKFGLKGLKTTKLQKSRQP